MDQELCSRLLEGRYKVEQHLGSGGFAHVYAVRKLDSGLEFAARIIDMPEPSIYKVALNEKKVLSSGCPYIVKLHELIYNEGYSIFILEKADHSLERVLQSILEEEALRAVSHSCSALLYFYANFGGVHLDIKPPNILCFKTNSETVYKLTDFSFARHAFDSRGLTSFKSISQDRYIGTGFYWPPEFGEQFARELLTEKADVYGLGLMLAQSLTNLPLRLFVSHIMAYFKMEDLGRFADNLAEKKSDGSFCSAVSESIRNRKLAEIVKGCLVPDRSERITVAELAERIKGYQKRRMFTGKAFSAFRNLVKGVEEAGAGSIEAYIEGGHAEMDPGRDTGCGLVRMKVLFEAWCRIYDATHSLDFDKRYLKAANEKTGGWLLVQQKEAISRLKEHSKPSVSSLEWKSLFEVMAELFEYRNLSLRTCAFLYFRRQFLGFINASAVNAVEKSERDKFLQDNDSAAGEISELDNFILELKKLNLENIDAEDALQWKRKAREYAKRMDEFYAGLANCSPLNGRDKNGRDNSLDKAFEAVIAGKHPYLENVIDAVFSCLAGEHNRRLEKENASLLEANQALSRQIAEDKRSIASLNSTLNGIAAGHKKLREQFKEVKQDYLNAFRKNQLPWNPIAGWIADYIVRKDPIMRFHEAGQIYKRINSYLLAGSASFLFLCGFLIRDCL